MDENLRRVTVTKCPTYQSDNGTGNYVFKLKRYYFGKDLSSLTPYLKIRFQDESTDKILLTNVTSDTETLTVTFTVTDAATRVAGDAKCQLCFENTDGSVCLNTEIFTVEILDSVEIESYGQTVLPSAIRMLQTKLAEQIESMNQRLKKVNESIVIKSVLVSAAGFSNGSQTLSVPEVKSDSAVLFAPATSALTVKNAGVYISSWEEGMVTLGCVNTPSTNFMARFAVINKVELAEENDN